MSKCFPIVGPLDCKEIQPVHSEGDQSWVFFGRNDGKAETLILRPPHAKSWLIGKDSDAGRDWGQEEKGTTEDEMAGWHHRLDGCESEWTPGDGDGQGGLACWDSWGRKESDTTEWLNWTELNGLMVFPTFFNLSLNLPIRSSWSEPQSSPGLVFAACIELLHLGCKEYNQSDLDVDRAVSPLLPPPSSTPGGLRPMLWVTGDDRTVCRHLLASV